MWLVVICLRRSSPCKPLLHSFLTPTMGVVLSGINTTVQNCSLHSEASRGNTMQTTWQRESSFTERRGTKGGTVTGRVTPWRTSGSQRTLQSRFLLWCLVTSKPPSPSLTTKPLKNSYDPNARLWTAICLLLANICGSAHKPVWSWNWSNTRTSRKLSAWEDRRYRSFGLVTAQANTRGCRSRHKKSGNETTAALIYDDSKSTDMNV